MGLVGVAALIANLCVAILLYRFRSGDANMRSVWICSRDDAIGNIAVVLAAGGVFGLGSAWPDLAVASPMAALGLSSGFQLMRQARAEMRRTHRAANRVHYISANKLLRHRGMHRWPSFFLCFMLMLSLGLGAAAHATENLSCIDATSATAFEHSDGDADQVAADADKAYPHHHGGCHGHHVAAATAANTDVPEHKAAALALAWSNAPMTSAPSGTTLRPPRA